MSGTLVLPVPLLWGLQFVFIKVALMAFPPLFFVAILREPLPQTLVAGTVICTAGVGVSQTKATGCDDSSAAQPAPVASITGENT